MASVAITQSWPFRRSVRNQEALERRARISSLIPVTQKTSRIKEVPNTEGLEDELWLRFLNPHDHTPFIQLVRASVFLFIFILFTVVTFGPSYFPIDQMDFGWAVMGGLIVSSVFITGFVLTVRRCMRKPNIIGLDMVKWFSFKAFIDVLYFALSPHNKKDARVVVYEGNMPPEFVETAQVEKIKENEEKEYTQEEHPEGSYFLDFVADTGDGFDTTYSVFASIASSLATIINPSDQADVQHLPRADAVIVGGDIAYPWPRYEYIMGRFVRPLSWAFPTKNQPRPVTQGHEEDRDESDLDARKVEGIEAPRMYILPGNHEYYDGLENFSKLILQRDHIGRWKTPVTTPYFAIKLPYKWWVFCVDHGSEACQDLDKGQIEYFTRIIRNHTTDDDRFILVMHEPDWIKNSGHHYSLYPQFQHFRDEVLGIRLRLTLGGDLHYYKRMEEKEMGETVEVSQYKQSEDQSKSSTTPVYGRKYITDKRQLVVAGHGGAFSHPTCNPLIEKIILGEPTLPVERRIEYVTVCDHPTPEQCRELMRNNWTSMFSFDNNWPYGHIVGAMYMLMFAAVSPASLLNYTAYQNETFVGPEFVNGVVLPTAWPPAAMVFMSGSYAIRALASAFFYPGCLWLLIEHFIVATTSQPLHDFRNRATAYSLATIHTLVHLLFAFGVRKLVDSFWDYIFSLQTALLINNPGTTVVYCAVANISIYVIGFFAGVFITECYLYFSFTFIGDGHSYNEAFCTFTERNFKGFQRIRFDASGDLTMWSLGIEKTPRSWRQTTRDERTELSPGFFVPAGDEELKLFLIEQVTLLRDPRKGGDQVDLRKSKIKTIQQQGAPVPIEV